MTSEQRSILRTNLDGDGNEYRIVSIEYPSGYHDAIGDARNDGLKIVSRMVESSLVYVDVYGADGSTDVQESRHFFERTSA